MSETQTPNGFSGLNLPDRLISTLNRMQFHTPTPIQAKAIPIALEGRDLIGIAQTGTGKTLAFGLPIAARLSEKSVALVLAPTRELAVQIHETLQQIGLRSAVIIGGAPMSRQIRDLRSNPCVVVATPGRLIDHLNQKNISLGRVSVVVLDEADRMFDMGFAPAIRTILEQSPKERQTLMFSATMPEEICQLAEQHLVDPARVEIERPGTAATNVEQEVWTVAHEDKHATLETILYAHEGTSLVFTRTRHGARKLAKAIRDLGISADEIHSDRSLAQRQHALRSFKNGAIRVLVATDIAARGIDVKEIGLVLNFDVPENPEDYVHRIGRTGRAGASGKAITLATPQQHRDVRDIERLLKKPLARFNASGMAEAARIDESAHRRPNRNRPPERVRTRPVFREARPTIVEQPRPAPIEPVRPIEPTKPTVDYVKREERRDDRVRFQKRIERVVEPAPFGDRPVKDRSAKPRHNRPAPNAAAPRPVPAVPNEPGSEARPPKRKGDFTPKQFRSPGSGKAKKPKSYVARQLVANGAKPSNGSRFEKSVASTWKGPKRKVGKRR